MHTLQGKLAAIWIVFLLTGLLAACAVQSSTPTAQPPTATLSATPSLVPSPTLTASFTALPTFAPPRLTPITPIPSPISGLEIPAQVRSAVILGTDAVSPYVGRTDAIALVLFNEETARASVISLPPDMFVYHPGYTMQRLNIAYAVGGFDQLSATIHYNFGVIPDYYALVHINDFANIVDELNGITVQARQRVIELCGDNPSGRVEMDGQQAFCFARVRQQENEEDRSRRQQEVYQAVFNRLVRGGTLSKLPTLYEAYRKSVETNLTLSQLAAYVPLALKLGDPGQITYYYFPNDDLTPWIIPDQYLPATVLIPDLDEVKETMRQAVAAVMTGDPLTGIVATLEYELTITPSPTPTLTSTATVTRTPTPYRSPVPTRTLTPTITRTPRDTRTPTITYTPTITATPTTTSTETSTPTPTDILPAP